MYKSCANKKKLVTVLDNSRDFLSRWVEKAIYNCLGISSKINVYRRAIVLLALHMVSTPAADGTNKTVSNPKLLTVGLGQIASSNITQGNQLR